LRVITIFGRDLVLPFLGWARVRNFENIDDEKRSEIEKYFHELEEMTKEIMGDAKKTEDKAKWVAPTIRKLHELSTIMLESNDICLRALGSQLKLTASVPETVRSALDDIAGQYTIETTSRMKIESILRNDYPRGFYLTTLLLYKWFQSVKDSPNIPVNRIELGEELIEAGKNLKRDYKSLRPVYKLFVKHCNKQMVGIETMPEILFLVNYLYRIFVEVLYEGGNYITIEKYEEFCELFGDVCSRIGKGLKYQDRMLIASTILELYEYTEQLSGEIYGN
jgi:hypothetical protein